MEKLNTPAPRVVAENVAEETTPMMRPWVTAWMVFTSPALITIFIFLLVSLKQNKDRLKTPNLV